MNKKRIKTEYKIVIVMLCFCFIVLASLFVYNKYFTFTIDIDDFSNCSKTKYNDIIPYEMVNCKIEDGAGKVSIFSYPILDEKNCQNCSSINQERYQKFLEEWEAIELVNTETNGLRVSYDTISEYQVNSYNGVLSILATEYETYPSYQAVGIKSYNLDTNGNLLLGDKILESSNRDFELVGNILNKTISMIYFIDYRYDYHTDSNPEYSINSFISSFSIDSLDAFYISDRNQLIGVKLISNPRVLSSKRAYYINLDEMATDSDWYNFSIEKY